MGWAKIRTLVDETAVVTEKGSAREKEAVDNDAALRFRSLALTAALVNAQRKGLRERGGIRSRILNSRKPLQQATTPAEDDSHAPTSLLCLTTSNPLRRVAISLCSHPYYEAFTMLLILASCTTLAMDSARQGFGSTRLGTTLQRLEYAWAGLMCGEIATRVVARGLLLPRSAFLRSGWGVLDVGVVALGFLNLLPGASNYSAIRAFRVLRPLRAVYRLPKLRVLVVTLLTALPMLLHVLILCSLVYFAFGVIGVEAFAGALRYSCATADLSGAYPGSLDGQAALLNVSYTVPEAEQGSTCRGPKLRDPGWLLLPGAAPAAAASSYAPALYDTSGGRQCDPGLYCVRGPNPSYGFISFDQILEAWLTIFQCITQEGWTDVMYDVQDAVSAWVWPYFVGIVVIGAWFLMNLALVVLYVQFTKTHAALRQEAAERAEAAGEAGEARQAGSDSDSDNDDSGGGRSSGSGSAGGSDSEREEDGGGGEKRRRAWKPGGGALSSSEYEEEEQEAEGRLRKAKGEEEGKGEARSDHQAEHARSDKAVGAVHAAVSRPSLWHRFRRRLVALSRSPALFTTTVAAILLNTLVMCVNWYGIPERLESALRLVNVGLTAYFTLELVVVLTALGPKRYFRDGMNLFDAAVVAASIAEVLADLLPGLGGVGPLSVLRGLRVLRLARLVSRWAGLRRVVRTLFKSVKSVAWMSTLLLLFLVIAALLGMQVFGYRFQFCGYVPGASARCPLGQRVWGSQPVGGDSGGDGAPCPDHFLCYLPCDAAAAGSWLTVPGSRFFGQAFCQAFCEDGSMTTGSSDASGGLAAAATAAAVSNGTAIGAGIGGATGADSRCEYLAVVGKADVPQSTFDNFGWSLLTVFQIVTGENWNDVMHDGMRSVGPTAALYFVFVIVVGNYVTLNLFVAILLENFAANMGDIAEPGAEAEERTGEAGGEAGAGAGAEGLQRSESFVRAEEEADRLWYKQTFGASHVHPSPYPAAKGGAGGGAGGAAHVPARGPAAVAVEMARAEELVAAAHKGEAAGGLEGAALGGEERERRLNQEEFLRGTSLGLFGPDSALRRACTRFITSRHFDVALLAAIGLSSVALALDSARMEEQHPRFTMVVRYLDAVWAAVFLGEAALKVVSAGLLLNGPHSYLRDSWNLLDCLIMLASVAMVVIQFAVPSGQENLQMLRALRALRALRPLRIASASEQLRVVLMSLFSSLRSLLHVGLVCLLFYLLFGILGVNLLKGELRYCADAASGAPLDAWALLPPGQAINSSWCRQGPHTLPSNAYLAPLNLSLPQPGRLDSVWVAPLLPSFDHLGVSVLTLFGVATTELWVSTMSAAMASVGPEQQPVMNNNPAMSLYIVSFIVVGAFLVLNLLVAITIEKFGELQARQLGHSLFLTPQQQAWVDVQRVLGDTAPQRRITPPEPGAPGWRVAAYEFAMSRCFQAFMACVILANIGVMALNHADMSPAWAAGLRWANAAFAALFLLEAGLQLAGLGPRQYLTDPWFLMLAAIAAASAACVALDAAGVGSFGLAPLLRVLRVTRFLHMISRVERLQQLVRTLRLALPAVVNVGSVLGLLLFVWAVLGMNLFGTMKFGEHLNRHNNFRDWPNSAMLLFRQVTGESWNGVMADCMVTAGCVLLRANVTSPSTGLPLSAGTYFNPGAQEIAGLPADLLSDQCSPSAVVAAVYFVSFELLCAYVIINIVVAIILEGCVNEEADEMLPVPRSAVEQFAEVWSELDPRATGWLPAPALPLLLMQLHPPLGVRGTASLRMGAQDVIMETDIPCRAGRFHFLETLHALAGRVAGAELPDATEEKVYGRLAARLPASPPTYDDVRYSAAHFHSAAAVAAAVRGFLARHALREPLAELRRQLAEAAEAEAAAKAEALTRHLAAWRGRRPAARGEAAAGDGGTGEGGLDGRGGGGRDGLVEVPAAGPGGGGPGIASPPPAVDASGSVATREAGSCKVRGLAWVHARCASPTSRSSAELALSPHEEQQRSATVAAAATKEGGFARLSGDASEHGGSSSRAELAGGSLASSRVWSASVHNDSIACADGDDSGGSDDGGSVDASMHEGPSGQAVSRSGRSGSAGCVPASRHNSYFAAPAGGVASAAAAAADPAEDVEEVHVPLEDAHLAASGDGRASLSAARGDPDLQELPTRDYDAETGEDVREAQHSAAEGDGGLKLGSSR